MMWVALVSLLFGAGIMYSLSQSRQRLETWRHAATSCGLEVVEAEQQGWNPRLKARTGLTEVRIETCGKEGAFARIAIEAPAPPNFHLLSIRREEFLETGQEIETGDIAFDSAFFIEGPRQLVFALLDAETRRQLLLVSARHKLQISTGTLQVEMVDEDVPRVLPRLLDLRQRFAPAMEIPRRLAENARQDPEDKVRLNNLLILVRELPGEPVTLDALRAACSDPNPEIQLQAARQLGGVEGRGVLLKIAERMEHDPQSAQAVSSLGRNLPFERATSILQRALEMRRLRTALACLETLSHGGAAAVEILVKVMGQEEGELAAAAARALGDIGDPAAEPPLILALQREYADLRVAAAKALGRVGSVEAVLPLKEASERSWLDRELRRASRHAIAEIQSRLQGASPGQLSLAGADAGQLSLVQAEAGQLSLATDPSGQLSLAPKQAERD